MMNILDDEMLAAALENLPGWKASNGFIEKSYVFRDFREAILNMISISFEAEALNHHPEWINVYNKLNIRLRTHDAGGVTGKDILLAKKIDELIRTSVA